MLNKGEDEDKDINIQKDKRTKKNTKIQKYKKAKIHNYKNAQRQKYKNTKLKKSQKY